jgi:hypothetical protein
MTSLASNFTSISSEPNIFGGGTFIDFKNTKEEKIINNACACVEKEEVLLGPIIMSSLFTLSAVALIIFVFSIFYTLPYITPKFALFLTMLFGGLASEVLWAKGIKKNE